MPTPPLGGGAGGTVPMNPTFGTVQQVTAGLASALRGKINGYAGSVESNVRYEQLFVEQYAWAHQQGWVSGGSLTGSPTSLIGTIAPYEAIAGNYLSSAGSVATPALSANNTNWVFLRQNGSVTVNTTGATPGTSDGYGTALLAGKFVTDGTAVTFVDRNRPLFFKESGRQVVSCSAGTSFLSVDQARNPIIEGTGAVTGTATLVLPVSDGEQWFIYNNLGGGGTMDVTCGTVGAGGTVYGGTVTVGNGKRAQVYSNGSAILRLTADV